MLTFHVALSFFGLLAGAIVLITLCSGSRRPTWDAALLVSTALISLTGFPLAAPPGTPTPDMVLAVYLNCFVAIVQGFLKINALQALAPTGSHPPFLFAQLPLLVLFVAIGVIAFKRRSAPSIR